MPDNYYPMPEDGGGDAPAAPKEKPADEQSDDRTALLPKSMFGGADPKEGEEYYFTVVHVYEDEVEVEYSKGEKKPEVKAATPMEEADGKMDMMAAGGNPGY